MEMTAQAVGMRNIYKHVLETIEGRGFLLEPGLLSLFLTFGYIPLPTVDFRDLPVFRVTEGENLIMQEHQEHVDVREKVVEGCMVLDSVFEKMVQPEKIQVVPLSGGKDSRLILGALLKLGLRKNIVAITFGTPGTLDYEIAKQVAKLADVRHECMDLEKILVSEEALLKTASSDEHWTWLFDSYYNEIMYDRFGRDAVIWSGFLGDAVAGGALLANDSTDLEEAVDRFIDRNALTFRLSSPDIMTKQLILKEIPNRNTSLSIDEQLNFGIRQENYIRPTVVKRRYNVCLPFEEHEWLTFMLNCPQQLRRNMSLYKEILIKYCPDLFSLGIKDNYGLPLFSSKARVSLRKAHLRQGYLWDRLTRQTAHKPSINYIDFATAVEREDYNVLVQSSLNDLNKRDVIDWLDIPSLYDEYLHGRRSLGMELLLLTALELNMKAKL